MAYVSEEKAWFAPPAGERDEREGEKVSSEYEASGLDSRGDDVSEEPDWTIGDANSSRILELNEPAWATLEGPSGPIVSSDSAEPHVFGGIDEGVEEASFELQPGLVGADEACAEEPLDAREEPDDAGQEVIGAHEGPDNAGEELMIGTDDGSADAREEILGAYEEPVDVSEEILGAYKEPADVREEIIDAYEEPVGVREEIIDLHEDEIEVVSRAPRRSTENRAGPVRARVAQVSARSLSWLMDGGVILAVVVAMIWSAMRFAGSGTGLAAAMSDGILVLLAVLLAGIVGAIYTGLSVFISGQTLGGRASGVKILDGGGMTPALVPSLVRGLAATLGVLSLGVGLAWILLDERGQAFHDRLAGTFAVEV